MSGNLSQDKMDSGCPHCHRRLGLRHLHKAMAGRKEECFVFCPECRCWLRCIPIKSNENRSFRSIVGMSIPILILIFGVPVVALVMFSVFQEVAFVIFGPVLLLMAWFFLFRGWLFTYDHRFVDWLPRCEKCGYDMRGGGDTCPECGGEVERHPQTLRTYGTFGW